MTVSNCNFDYIKFNAIQSNTNTVSNTKYYINQGLMKIKNNKFTNGKDRIIRLGEVSSNTQYVIHGNKASNFYDSDKEVMKASSLETGIVYDIANNDWGDGTSVHNNELKDR